MSMLEKELSFIGGASDYCIDSISFSSAITRFFKSLHNNEQIENIKDTLQKYESDLEIIKEALLDKDFFRNTPIYEEDFLSVFQKAKDEFNEEKRCLLANYLAACRNPDNIDCISKPVYLRIVEQVNYLDVIILNYLSCYHTEKFIIDHVSCNYKKEANPDDIRIHLWGLEPLGLIEKRGAEDLEKMIRRGGNRKLLHPENVYLYKRSGLGNGFYNFIIKGIPNI